MPRSRRKAGPIPGMSPSWCRSRKAISSPAGTTNTPPGFACRVAILAMKRGPYDPPSDTVIPVSSRTARWISRAASSSGTSPSGSSRYASSMLARSSTSAWRRSTANTSRLFRFTIGQGTGAATRSGQIRNAVAIGIAFLTPSRRAP